MQTKQLTDCGLMKLNLFLCFFCCFFFEKLLKDFPPYSPILLVTLSALVYILANMHKQNSP